MTPLQHLLEMGILSSDIEHRQDFLELSDQKDYQVAINLMCWLFSTAAHLFQTT